MSDLSRATDAFMRDSEWKDRLILSDKGKVLATFQNAVIALQDAPEWSGALVHNEFSNTIQTTRATPAGNVPISRWSDGDTLRTLYWLQEQGISVGRNVAADAIEKVASERCVHPVREHLEALRWDGRSRLDRWLIDYFGADHTPYVRAVGACWLISAAARIFQPGCKADHCLVLEGSQGIGKSTGLRILGGAWFTDELADLHSKDSSEQLSGVWILELSELDAVSRSENSRIKAFLSRTADRYRPSYGRFVIEHQRQCVFAGSVNVSQWATDETGSRRWWPVRVRQLRKEELERDRDQLLAEAVHRYRAGASWWLDSAELVKLATEEQAERYNADVWEEKVERFIFGKVSASVGEALGYLGKPEGTWTQADKNRIARCFISLGWERYREKAGSREWRYRPQNGDDK